MNSRRRFDITGNNMLASRGVREPRPKIGVQCLARTPVRAWAARQSRRNAPLARRDDFKSRPR
ncbi:MAG: hypothetical protein AMXMBFR82_41640 [Candidatus Hydrogenedentota bacterium]